MTFSKKIVIIGTGLGGSVLAHALKDVKNIELNIVEFDKSQARLMSVSGVPYSQDAKTASFGLGGTTKLWHNGLIEIEESIFKEKWPYNKNVLDPYYLLAWRMFVGKKYDAIIESSLKLKCHLVDCGIREGFLNSFLYYPYKRLNAWKNFGSLSGANLINGCVDKLIHEVNDSDCKIVAVKVVRNGVESLLSGDIFILACGGLATPKLLRHMSSEIPLLNLKNAGRFYEDHPTCFVADITTKKPFYKYWNFRILKSGFLRYPIRIKNDNLLISFQIRPRANTNAKKIIKSHISTIRNNPFSFYSYFKLLSSINDLFDLLSIKFGINLPTNRYSLLMVAEQIPNDSLAINSFDRNSIHVNWKIDSSYIELIEKSIHEFINGIDFIDSYNIYPGWSEELHSSCHHSGTAKMGLSPLTSVCDENGLVFNFSNLFICDASMIPSSGYSNTGLTIAALAHKLAAFICKSLTVK